MPGSSSASCTALPPEPSFHPLENAMNANLLRFLPIVPLALALAACGASGADAPSLAATATPLPIQPVAANDAERTALVDEVAATLQACSYDGAPVRVPAGRPAPAGECRDLVDQVMAFTGLPPNFTV